MRRLQKFYFILRHDIGSLDDHGIRSSSEKLLSFFWETRFGNSVRREILAELDLIGFKDRHPMSLSGGQKQRVAIASAIASKRSILFFDEPTSGLDYKHMKEVANVLKQVRDAGITLYVITHDLELLLDCCTDIVHFEDGSIIDKFQMDEAGLEKIRNYFIKGVPTK